MGKMSAVMITRLRNFHGIFLAKHSGNPIELVSDNTCQLERGAQRVNKARKIEVHASHEGTRNCLRIQIKLEHCIWGRESKQGMIAYESKLD